MPAMHMKGFVLQKLLADGPLWDYEVVRAVEGEYGVSGEYWAGTIRLTLIDLYSGGLLDELEAAIDPVRNGARQKVRFRYQVNAFGRERMTQSGLLEVTP